MTRTQEIGAFILRLVLGLTLFIHGIAKFQTGLGNTAQFFESLGIPSFLGYIVAIIELVGGFAMLLGLGTRIVSTLFAFVMLGAIFTVKLAAGFMGNGQMAGYEFDLALLAMSVSLSLTGSQLYALDSLFRKK
ncbi:DoxX family protein [Aneurinibacillus sp. REN35]|uniref:DoxX family protein n=1 Tax=Aneurinibacillus sp. REN35 TaxID=3237286 RepID=UPI0035289291